jgi:hypothetical protein
MAWGKCNADGGARVPPATRTETLEEPMIPFIVMSTIIIVGLIGIALGYPRRSEDIVVWNDETERRMLREGKHNAGWW